MGKQYATCWVRTRVAPSTKEWIRVTAELMGWNIPGVESAAIAFVTSLFTPQEFASHLLDALQTPDPNIPDNTEAANDPQ